MTQNHAFLHRLRGRHALLEYALEQERRRPAPNALRVAQIKKKKLQLKDRLAALERRAEIASVFA